MRLQPTVKALGDGRFRLSEEVIIPFIGGTRPYDFVIDAGFVTDFATIPWWAQWLIRSDDPRVIGPALGHDLAYQTHVVSRAVADAIFYERLRFNNVPRITAKLMHRAVAWGGKKAYMTGPKRLLRDCPHLAHLIASTPSFE